MIPNWSAKRIEDGALAALYAFLRGDRMVRILRHERTGEVLHIFGFAYRREGDPDGK